MKIIYIHHGNRNLGNPPSQNDDLTEIGYKDCALVAQLLETAPIGIKQNLKAIYIAPNYRCIKTAEAVNKSFNLPIIEDFRLDEFGSVKNENWVDVQNRVCNCIDDIINSFKEEDVVICITSGVNLSAFINKAYGLSSSEQAPFLGVANCCPIVFDYKKDQISRG